jgi:hypothetical protein
MLYDHESSIKALCQEIVDFNEFIFGDMEIFFMEIFIRDMKIHLKI